MAMRQFLEEIFFAGEALNFWASTLVCGYDICERRKVSRTRGFVGGYRFADDISLLCARYGRLSEGTFF